MSVSQHQTNFKMLLIFNKFDQIEIGMERPARAIGRYALWTGLSLYVMLLLYHSAAIALGKQLWKAKAR